MKDRTTATPDAEVAAQSRAVVLGRWIPRSCRRDDLVDEGVNVGLVEVGLDPKAVDGSGVKPLLEVAGDHGGRSYRCGVLADAAVGEDVVQRPARPATSSALVDRGSWRAPR